MKQILNELKTDNSVRLINENMPVISTLFVLLLLGGIYVELKCFTLILYILFKAVLLETDDIYVLAHCNLEKRHNEVVVKIYSNSQKQIP